MLKRFADLLCLCCFVLSAAPASAQPAVPIEQEPAHQLVLQNDKVRVFDVGLAPGEATLWHVHRHDGMSVRLTDATIEDQPEDGQAEALSLHRGELAFGATPNARAHRVRNVGETTFRNLYIELLIDTDASAGRAVAAADSTGRRVAFENVRVRALRRILEPGESTAVHTHAASGVAVVVTAGRLEISYPEAAARTVDIRAGTVQWIQPGTTHALKNVGTAPIEMVDVELK